MFSLTVGRKQIFISLMSKHHFLGQLFFCLKLLYIRMDFFKRKTFLQNTKNYGKGLTYDFTILGFRSLKVQVTIVCPSVTLLRDLVETPIESCYIFGLDKQNVSARTCIITLLSFLDFLKNIYCYLPCLWEDNF